ncbi:MAG: glycoside hydrolase family 3 N-terminal domain-containing protein [Candidatus Aminicenantaceae bacterium]
MEKKLESKRINLIIAFLIIIITGTCARIPHKPQLFFGPGEGKWVNKTMEKMTIEEKIGQMVVLRYSGYFVNRDSDYIKRLESLIVERKIGGLILSGGEAYETAYLTNMFQNMAKTPLLIASDFERGAGNQIRGATKFPPLMGIGATGSEELAYQMGKITAVEGRAMGIHVTYAPVVDVNINPINPIINARSFGEDPEQVSLLAKAFIRGCQENGLIATAKHFPGHGDTDLDSHSHLPTVNADRERLEKVELYPFKQAIEAGVQAIMTAHIHLPALDSTPDLPATLSPVILTELLRKRLRFKGIVVTDSMGMGGVTTLYGPEEAAMMAVKAGVDMVLLPPKPEQVIGALIKAVSSGDISEKRIDVSVKRILEAKARLGLHRERLVEMDSIGTIVASKAHLQQAARTFEHSVTLVKNDEEVLPISNSTEKIAVFSLSSDPGSYYAGRSFVSEVQKRCPYLISFYADCYTGDEFIKQGVENASNAQVVICALFSSLRAWKGSVDLEPRHIQLVKELAKGPYPVSVVSFGSPYFLRHFPEVDSYLCAYRDTPQAQEAAAKALFGEIEVKGKLPVTLPGLYPIGHGLVLQKSE